MSQDKKEYFSAWSSKCGWVIKSTAAFKTAADWGGKVEEDILFSIGMIASEL